MRDTAENTGTFYLHIGQSTRSNSFCASEPRTFRKMKAPGTVNVREAVNRKDV